MTDFRDQFNGNLSFGFDKPDFQKEYGTGTISENRDKESSNKSNNTADIISASADGLDSVGGIISMFMGKPNPNEQSTYTAPPPSEKAKVSPLLIGGISLGVILLIVLLISSNNGKAKQA
jgi:hypothetical protein